MSEGQNISTVNSFLNEAPSNFPVTEHENLDVLGGKTLYKAAWFKAVVLVKTTYYGEEKYQLRLYSWEKKDGDWNYHQSYNISQASYVDDLASALARWVGVNDPEDLLDHESIGKEQDLNQRYLQLQKEKKSLAEKKKELEKRKEKIQEEAERRLKEMEKERRSKISEMGEKVDEFEEQLEKEELEKDYQDTLKENVWFFGTRYFGVEEEVWSGMDNRNDFLIERNDQFHDIVELKRPDHDLFWEDKPWKMKAELRDAISQMARYLHHYQTNHLYVESNMEQDILNPRGIIVIGRTENDTHENIRRLESALSGDVEILTYDDLVDTARNAIDHYENAEVEE